MIVLLHPKRRVLLEDSMMALQLLRESYTELSEETVIVDSDEQPLNAPEPI